MNENLVFEGNTIYEIDPVCLKEKRMQGRRAANVSGYFGQRAVTQSLGGRHGTDTGWILLCGIVILNRNRWHRKRK